MKRRKEMEIKTREGAKYARIDTSVTRRAITASLCRLRFFCLRCCFSWRPEKPVVRSSGSDAAMSVWFRVSKKSGEYGRRTSNRKEERRMEEGCSMERN
jgi:hypothetical protein